MEFSSSQYNTPKSKSNKRKRAKPSPKGQYPEKKKGKMGKQYFWDNVMLD
jgi:hypothetical protein